LQVVQALLAAGGPALVWDPEEPGLCIRVQADGSGAYALRYVEGDGRRWRLIGGVDRLTPEQARERARRVREGSTAAPQMPFATQSAGGSRVADLIERYLEDGPLTKPWKRASTWVVDASNLRRHVLPLLGDRNADEVTKLDVSRMVRAVTDGATACDVRTGPRGRAIVTGGSGTAKRVLGTTAAMFSWGVEQGLTKANPARGIRLSRRRAVERFLTPAQAARMLKVLGDLEGSGSVSARDGAILRLLLFTGARKSELLGLRWTEYQPERAMLVLPPERTKAGQSSGERRIALSEQAIAILRAQPRQGPYVFPAARDPQRPAVDVNSAWDKVRIAADLPGFRVHDLRHSFASFAIANGASLYAVGKALGHADAKTTQRYAHVAETLLRDLAEETAERILSGVRSTVSTSAANQATQQRPGRCGPVEAGVDPAARDEGEAR
jgi:integrase